MPSKKRIHKVQDERSDRVIRYVALSVILVVVGVIAWNMIPDTVPEACQYFISIPAADQYDEPPPMLIDPKKSYQATVTLEKGGEIVIELLSDKAPNTVNNFIFLACKGFYDDVTFHRVLPGFMAQAGDPTGTGNGGPGYRFANEDSDLIFDREGVVAMANAGRDTNGSQFFITFGPAGNLNGGYTIFGQVISGMEHVLSITFRDPDRNPDFEGDRITSIMISEQ